MSARYTLSGKWLTSFNDFGTANDDIAGPLVDLLVLHPVREGFGW